MTESSIHRARRRAAALLVVAALCASGTACGADASAKPAEKKARPILTEKSVVRAWKDYDKANNGAMPQAGPPKYDGSAYAVADTGPLLDEDLTNARISKVDHAKASKPFSNTSVDLYAPLENAGFALSTTKQDDDVMLHSLVREKGSWKQEMNLWLEHPRTRPMPLEPGKQSHASQADIERARKALASVTSYWDTSRAPSDVILGQARDVSVLVTARKTAASKFDIRTNVSVQGVYRTGVGKDEAFRVVRVKGGLLALAAVRNSLHAVSHQSGVTLTRGGDLAKLFGKDAGKQTTARYVSTVALSIPDRGKVRVLGATSVLTLK